MSRYTTPLALALFVIIPLPADSAPLDEFLTAVPGYKTGQGEVEVGIDIMNSTVDLFGFREEDPRGGTIGNYSGFHIRGGLNLTQRLFIEGNLWKRGVKTPYDEGESYSWRGAAQFQMTHTLGWLPALALRASSWGSSSESVLKGSETSLMSKITTSSIRVDSPEDHQYQGDIIATWTPTKNTALSLFFGIGQSEVDFNAAYVKLKGLDQGCEYQVTAKSTQDDFGDPITRVELDLIDQENSNQCDLISASVPLPNDLTLPSGLFIEYDSTFMQLGGNLSWYNETWRTKLGYRFQKWDRDDVDDAVLKYQHVEKIGYTTNHNLTAEVAYRIFENTAVFARGQYMRHQFLGDVPFSYNLYSAHKFKNQYGFVTLGLVQGF